MAIYGYVRVSSKDQNPDRQVDALVEKGVKWSNLYVDYESGKNFNRKAYRKLLKKLKQGDVVVVKSIDRLGRNYSEILEQWRIITQEKKTDIDVLDMPLLNTRTEKDGLTGRLIADLVLEILAYVAETERSFIKQRQREGIESAKRRGVKFGRPRTPETTKFEEAYQKWSNHEWSSRKAAAYAGMSHTSFYHRAKELQERLQN